VIKIQIEEVEEILNSSGLLALLAPKHVFITDEEIVQHMGQEVVHFRGVAPRNRRGIMVLSRARIFKVKYAEGSTPEKYKGRVKHYVKVVV